MTPTEHIEAWMKVQTKRGEKMAKERPFGSFNIGAEMAVTMGMDPRPYLTEEQIAEELKRSGKTREDWDAGWDYAISQRDGDFSDVPF
jgi:hypothetical protein